MLGLKLWQNKVLDIKTCHKEETNTVLLLEILLWTKDFVSWLFVDCTRTQVWDIRPTLASYSCMIYRSEISLIIWKISMVDIWFSRYFKEIFWKAWTRHVATTMVNFIIHPSSIGTYYGMVMSIHPSGSPAIPLSVRPSVHPSLCPPVFHTFLQLALTYWAEILHMTLFYCTTDQIRVSSIYVNFFGSYAPFGTQNTENTVFRTFLLHALTYWAEILHMALFYCNTDQVWVSSICVNF